MSCALSVVPVIRRMPRFRCLDCLCRTGAVIVRTVGTHVPLIVLPWTNLSSLVSRDIPSYNTSPLSLLPVMVLRKINSVRSLYSAGLRDECNVLCRVMLYLVFTEPRLCNFIGDDA